MATKFNINRPPVSDEEINSHKDFGELVNKFKKQSIEKARSDSNFLKNKKATYSAIIAGVAVVCTVTYFSVFKKNPPKQISNDKTSTTQNSTLNHSKTSKAFIQPPVAKLNVPYASYKVNAANGGTIKHSSNSKITIPKKAFVNKSGEDIIGDVEIKYREFHNQADIIASGIPMTYDSAGVHSALESAGMIDIKGYQNGEPVFINPKKQITVEFKSEYPSDKYNMYVLDTVAENWTYLNRDNSLKGHEIPKREMGVKGQDNEISVNSVSEKTKELQKQLDAIPPKIENEKNAFSKKIGQLQKVSEPIKPAKAIEGKPQFELEVDYKEFPELASFKNAVFEVGSENKNFNSKLADITWSSVEISEGTQKGKNYLLTLKFRERTEKLIVYPVLVGTNYENALKIYETKFNDYKVQLTKREANELKLKQEFEAKQAEFVLQQKNITAELIRERIRFQKELDKSMNEQMNNASNSSMVTRIFNVNSFNIYNSDCATKMPEGKVLNPLFITSKSNNVIRPSAVYLICHTKNIVYAFKNEAIPYDPTDVYSMCVISNGEMYLCDKTEFKKCLANKTNKIPLTQLSSEADSAIDLKMALGI
jgi:hypothetical protein